MTSIFKYFIYCTCILFCGCYGFKGITIPPDINTFYVEDFTLTKSSAPAEITQIFAEALRRKIREESRLVNDDNNPDIIFEGNIVDFRITSIAPEEGTTTSLNRLEIVVSISYSNEKNEEDNWTKRYSDFEDYDSTEDFQNLQDDLIDVIVEDIMERIFNDTFTNW